MKRGRHKCKCERTVGDAVLAGIPISSDPSPKTPPPANDRLMRLEGRVGVLEAVLKDYDPRRSINAQTEAQPRQAPRSVPDGVVPPHVRRNLEVLAEWMNPDNWQVGHEPGETHRVRTMLNHFYGLVMTAMAGEDVPRP